MKKLILISVFTGILLHNQAQSLRSLGLGYFGETGVYKGLVLEMEWEPLHSERFSTPLRADLGWYSHPRSHDALFLDLHQGLRRSFNNGITLESSVGVGIMLSIYNETVFSISEDGTVREASRLAAPDLMPSITLGAGYDLARSPEKRAMIWIRPKLFWQFPYNTLALPHLALQIGYTHTLKTL